jgi:DNA primase
MERKERLISCAEANEIDMVQCLKKLGYHPSKIHHHDHWYLSPLRQERTPSFKVNRRINRWYDHGIAQGGTLLDFMISFYHCSIPEVLRILSNHSGLCLSHNRMEEAGKSPELKLEITAVHSLSSPVLLSYLKQRAIDIDLAVMYCRQVDFRIGEKGFYGIGFPNLSDGYEIRNAFLKYSSAPKDISVIQNNGDSIAVFEGFMDFLTFLSLKDKNQGAIDYLVLNGIGFFERARYIMEAYGKISLYLDRDKAGRIVTQKAMQLSPAYQDESNCYKEFKDLNEWAMNLKDSKKKKWKHIIK